MIAECTASSSIISSVFGFIGATFTFENIISDLLFCTPEAANPQACGDASQNKHSFNGLSLSTACLGKDTLCGRARSFAMSDQKFFISSSIFSYQFSFNDHNFRKSIFVLTMTGEQSDRRSNILIVWAKTSLLEKTFIFTEVFVTLILSDSG